MMNISSRTRTMLPTAMALVLASWGAMAAPPEKETPIDKEPATQMTQPTPPKTTTAATTQSTAAGNMQAEFDARDTNRDGFIDKSEANSDKKLLTQFNKLDADKDGKLSATEFMNAKNLAKLTLKNNDRGMSSQRQ